MSQLEFPQMPERETRQIQTVLDTPPRQRLTITIWERDDEPDHLVWGVDALDGDGTSLAHISGVAQRTEMWEAALEVAVARAKDVWYDTHSPYC